MPIEKMVTINIKSAIRRCLRKQQQAVISGTQNAHTGKVKYSLQTIPPAKAITRYKKGYLKLKFTPT